MKFKVTQCMVGDNYVWKAGDVVTIEDKAEAGRLLEAGFVVPVAEEPEIAVVPAVAETRAKKK